MGRDILVLNHLSLHPALQRELERRGLMLCAEGAGEAALRDNPGRVLGVYTWFYEGLRHPLQVWWLRQRLRPHRIPLFAWNQDAPHYLNRAPWRLDLLDRSRLYDLYATHTLIDTRRQFADAIIYLPNAADVESYHLNGTTLAELRNPDRYLWDVSFIGAMNGRRYKEMQAREVFFAALGDRLREKGIRFLFREATGLSAAEQVELIQRSRINLNFGACCEYGAPVASGLPERCYGIPACGGFLLCDRRLHARDDFVLGENWAEYEGLEDCVAKIDFWLRHFDLARELAERCHHHVLANHTYAHRAEKLHQALEDWHAGKRGRLG